MVAYSFKERFVKPIEVGLSRVSLSFDPLPKRQTIRAIGKRRHARPGEILQLYYGMRSKWCRLIGTAKCTAVTPICIKFDDVVFWIFLDGAKVRISHDQADEFARKDGFADRADMQRFWLAEHKNGGEFHGRIVEWEPII